MESSPVEQVPEATPTAASFPEESLDSPFYYFRYFVGHRGRHGKEYLEFEINYDGTLKYGNNSEYRRDSIIKKQAKVAPAVLDEIKRLVIESKILQVDDALWPEPDRNGRQELEVRIGGTHVSFVTNKISLTEEIEQSRDPQGLGALFLLVRDVKALVLAMISLHFKIKAI